MLDGKGFDSWAYQYDESVRNCDERGDYPFAGYRDVLEKIADAILKDAPADVLDVGFGTGILAKRLYDGGCRIYGQDYSQTMLQIAGEKMPEATLVFGDLSKGLAAPLDSMTYDRITATYALHHFSTKEKCVLLRHLLDHLRPGGMLMIGDIAFEDAAAQEACRKRFADDWDEEECYMLFDEMKRCFPELTYERISHCCGLFTLKG